MQTRRLITRTLAAAAATALGLTATALLAAWPVAALLAAGLTAVAVIVAIDPATTPPAPAPDQTPPAPSVRPATDPGPSQVRPYVADVHPTVTTLAASVGVYGLHSAELRDADTTALPRVTP